MDEKLILILVFWWISSFCYKTSENHFRKTFCLGLGTILIQTHHVQSQVEVLFFSAKPFLEYFYDFYDHNAELIYGINGRNEQ